MGSFLKMYERTIHRRDTMLSHDKIAKKKTEVFKKIEDAARRGDVQRVVYAVETIKDIEKKSRRLDNAHKYHIDAGFVL